MSLNSLFQNIRPHKFFLFAAIIFGIVYNIVSPPLQAPDEYDHFRRAYHLSEGHFLPEKKDNRLGGEIPISFKEFITPYRLSATNLKYTLTKEQFTNSFKVPFNNSEKEFNDFPNTSFYSLISYFPHVVAMTVAKQFTISTATLFYSGRLFTFLVWIVVTWFLIKTVPIYKWLFTLLALLPMNIYISNSYSADTVTNLLSFMLIVFILKYAFDDKEFNYKRLLFLITIAVLLAFSKVVYVGLIFLIFIIPAGKFRSKQQYLFLSAVILVCSFSAAYIWSQVVMTFYTPYHIYNPAFRDASCISSCGNYPEQKKYILSHGLYFLNVVYRSLFDHPYTYLVSYIGAFGGFDIPMPTWLTVITYIVIIIVASIEIAANTFSRKQKFILFFTGAFTLVFLLLSQHLTWDCVGEGVVDLIQGRYLIPIFPLFIVLFTGYFPKIKIPVKAFVTVLVFVMSYFAVTLIYGRYFKDSYISKVEFACGAEELVNANLFKTSNPDINLSGIDSRNDRVVRTGKYSVELSERSPYAFTFNFKDLRQGDLIEMSAWQKGEGAQMVITGKGKKCGEFYYPYYDIKYKGADGWSRLEFAMTMNLHCTAEDSTEVGFFIWNPNKGTKTYIDDLKFSIKKFGTNYIDRRPQMMPDER